MKNNISYYPHYADADQHAKFKMLRVEYGWEGEGKFWALNNRIALADGCKLDISKKYNKASIAADLDLSLEQFDRFVSFLLDECELLFWADGVSITTHIIQETLEKVSKDREKARKRYDKKVKTSGEKQKTSGEKCKTSQESPGSLPRKNIESKVKESKVNKKKENNTKENTTGQQAGPPSKERFLPSKMKPDDVSEESWQSLIEHRKKKRSANTKRAYQLLLNEFEKSGLKIEDCIDMMILRDWRGFKAEWAIKEKNSQLDKKTCADCSRFCMPGEPDDCHKFGGRTACERYAG